MKEVFADTSFWIALLNEDDEYHQKAHALQQSYSKALTVTTDEVLTEFLAYFSGRGTEARRSAAEFVRTLLNHANVAVLPQSRESFLAGLALYEARSDKEYSLTDCISMRTMQQRGCVEALTTDRHFLQEGLHRLMVTPLERQCS
jgi:predicted nucleic acid-binding protein